MTAGEDPYLWIRKPDEGSDSDLDRIWAEIRVAIANFDPRNAGPLISLLLDDDPLIRRRGLHIFGSLPRTSFVALDAALSSVDNPDLMARSDLMDGVICYPRSLTAYQTRIVLKLVDDPEDLVRFKVVAFLGCARRRTIEAAIELLDEPQRVEYRRAFPMFDAEPSQAQALFDRALTEQGVASTFAFASIDKMARERRLREAPKYDGDDWLGRSVLTNVERLLERGHSREAIESRPGSTE